MGIFTPFATLYYGVLLKIKFRWFSRVKNKKRNETKNVLQEKLNEGDLEEECIEKIIENYLGFGETIFDRKVLQKAFSLDRIVIQAEQNYEESKDM